MTSKISFGRAASALAIAASTMVASAAPLLAQGLPGLVLFGGVEQESQLGYRLDFNGIPRRRDRYRLRIARRDLPIGVSQITISYPDYFDGSFDLDDIEMKVEGEEVALESVDWDEQNYELRFFPIEPIPANSRVEIIMSNVRNPRDSGFYYFHALALPTGDVPIRRYVGTWIIGIGGDD